MLTYLRSWNLVRLLRLLLGIYAIAEGVRAELWLLAAPGILFSSMSLFNIGGCSGSACAAPEKESDDKKLH